jgi:hypothetical protein
LYCEIQYKSAGWGIYFALGVGMALRVSFFLVISLFFLSSFAHGQSCASLFDKSSLEEISTLDQQKKEAIAINDLLAERLFSLEIKDFSAFDGTRLAGNILEWLQERTITSRVEIDTATTQDELEKATTEIHVIERSMVTILSANKKQTVEIPNNNITQWLQNLTADKGIGDSELRPELQKIVNEYKQAYYESRIQGSYSDYRKASALLGRRLSFTVFSLLVGQNHYTPIEKIMETFNQLSAQFKADENTKTDDVLMAVFTTIVFNNNATPKKLREEFLRAAMQVIQKRGAIENMDPESRIEFILGYMAPEIKWNSGDLVSLYRDLSLSERDEKRRRLLTLDRNH